MGKKRKQSKATRGSSSREAGEVMQKRKNGPKSKNEKCSEDFESLQKTLARFGLKIKKVDADGNCLFRAFADQIVGKAEEHARFRAQAVEFLLEHKEEFAGFIEDDEPFDQYHRDMSKDGFWGGHLELHLLSLINKVNVLVHQQGERSWEVKNFPIGYPCVQLSYHDGDHFNSVRLADDDGSGPPVAFSLFDIHRTSEDRQASIDGALLSVHREETKKKGTTETENVEELLSVCPRGTSKRAAIRSLGITKGDVKAALQLINGHRSDVEDVEQTASSSAQPRRSEHNRTASSVAASHRRHKRDDDKRSCSVQESVVGGSGAESESRRKRSSSLTSPSRRVDQPKQTDLPEAFSESPTTPSFEKPGKQRKKERRQKLAAKEEKRRTKRELDSNLNRSAQSASSYLSLADRIVAV